MQLPEPSPLVLTPNEFQLLYFDPNGFLLLSSGDCRAVLESAPSPTVQIGVQAKSQMTVELTSFVFLISGPRPAPPLSQYSEMVVFDLSFRVLVVCNGEVTLKMVTCSWLAANVLLSANNIHGVFE